VKVGEKEERGGNEKKEEMADQFFFG